LRYNSRFFITLQHNKTFSFKKNENI